MIPAELLTQDPMLACPAKAPIAQLLDDYRMLYDVKWDGIRALVYVADGTVVIRNKSGADITRRYPDVVAAAKQLPGELVFDGEIVVCNSQTGRFEFHLALKRDAQSLERKIATLARQLPATYMAFDLLYANGVDLRGKPLSTRLTELRAVPKVTGVEHSLASANGEAMWAAVKRFGFEGLIAKEHASRYRSGRQSSWTKLKAKKRVTAIVTGWEPGEGSRNDMIGALFLSLLRDGKLVPIGKVGTGLKRDDHAPMLSVLRDGEEFLVEVEYLEATSDGQLRQPSYKGVRVDVSREDCTVDQLTPR